MKSKIFLVVLALVVAIHAVLLLYPFGFGEGEENPPQDGPATAKAEPEATRDSLPGPGRDDNAAPHGEPSGEPPPVDADPSEESVDRAVALVKRADASTPRPAPEQMITPSVETSESTESIKIGRVEGTSQLTPELRELGTEGAKAVASQNWKGARDIYLEMVQKAPDNALAYANLGVAEHQLGNLLAASGNLRKSLEINPSIAQNWQTLGLIHFKRQELELAISHLTRAIHEDPSDARSRLYLAAVVREYGWDDAAVKELERAVETDPGLADAHYNLAVSYLDETPPRVELARRHYYSAIDLGAKSSPFIESVLKMPKAEPTEP